jgi:hypothetical protein
MAVELHRMNARDWAKAIGLGVATAVILAILNVLALKSHASPLPEPLGLAFADTLLGRHVPLPVGLLFHVLWVTFFAVVYVVLWRDRMTFGNAAKLALVLWLIAVIVFFPMVGWGVFGLAVSPKLLLPATVSHLLFAVILWGLAHLTFGRGVGGRAPQPGGRVSWPI